MEVEGIDLAEGDARHFQILDDGRLKCTLNGHVLPSNADAISSFVRGSKFQRLKKQAEDDAKLADLKPFIVTSRNFPGKLYCALTCSVMNKNWSGVQRHVEGQRYRKAKDIFTKGDSQLMEEPDLIDSEGDGDDGGNSDVDEVMEGCNAHATAGPAEKLKEAEQKTGQSQLLGLELSGEQGSRSGQRRRKHQYLASRPKRLKRPEA